MEPEESGHPPSGASVAHLHLGPVVQAAGAARCVRDTKAERCGSGDDGHGGSGEVGRRRRDGLLRGRLGGDLHGGVGPRVWAGPAPPGRPGALHGQDGVRDVGRDAGSAGGRGDFLRGPDAVSGSRADQGSAACGAVQVCVSEPSPCTGVCPQGGGGGFPRGLPPDHLARSAAVGVRVHLRAPVRGGLHARRYR